MNKDTRFKAFYKHWNEVGPRYNWVFSQLKASGAQKRFDYISNVVSEKIALRLNRMNFFGQEKPTPEALRVTQIYCEENGGRKLMHRHTDTFPKEKAPGVTSIRN